MFKNSPLTLLVITNSTLIPLRIYAFISNFLKAQDNFYPYLFSLDTKRAFPTRHYKSIKIIIKSLAKALAIKNHYKIRYKEQEYGLKHLWESP